MWIEELEQFLIVLEEVEDTEEKARVNAPKKKKV